MYPRIPPEFLASFGPRDYVSVVLGLASLVGGLGLMYSTGAFVYHGLRGAPEEMNNAGTIMYIAGTMCTVAAYGIKRVIEREERGRQSRRDS